jgi:cytochrome c5
MRKGLVYLLFLIVACVVIVACAAQPTPTPLPPPTPVPTLSPLPPPTATLKPPEPTAPPPPTQPPAPSQASTGASSFTSYCTCHSVGFSKQAVTGYRTAQRLLDYIAQRMPPGNPQMIGKITRYSIVAYIIDSAGFLPPGVVVADDTIASISLQEAAAGPVDQVTAGKQAFGDRCTDCHSAGIARDNIVKYGSADTLFKFVRSAMPPGNPDVVSDTERYDIVAYLLSTSGLLPEGQAVSGQTAASIVFAQPTAVAAADQPEAGRRVFDSYCRACHVAGIGESVLLRYRTAEAVFQFVRSNMPPGNPTRVAEQGHWDVVAYLLSEAGLLPAGQEVTPDTAGDISFGE